MSRPAHIAPLDAALDTHLEQLAEAERHHAHVLAEHAQALQEVENAKTARVNAYYAARSCEKAIRKLGYCVLGVVSDQASRLDPHSGRFNEPPSIEESA